MVHFVLPQRGYLLQKKKKKIHTHTLSYLAQVYSDTGHGFANVGLQRPTEKYIFRLKKAKDIYFEPIISLFNLTMLMPK